VGGKTQARALRNAAETLRLDYAQFLELEIFTRFGGVTDVQVKGKIARGQRIRAVLSQPQYLPLRLADEVALVLALQTGLLDPLPLENIAKFRSELPTWLDRSVAPIVTAIERTGQLEDVRIGELTATVSALVAQFVSPSFEPRTK
jgi:F-type H+-transporting ATPase subunit alpha